jgi:hypothetical protein
MADRRDNVVALPGRGGVDSGQPVRFEVLRAAAGQLDELGCCLQQFSPRPSWSPRRWMIASTPFRMRLASARKGLDDLAIISSGNEQNAMRGAFELNDARHEVERQLRDIGACLYSLHDADTSPAERARETQKFTSGRFELLKVLREIRHLITREFPTVADGSRGRFQSSHVLYREHPISRSGCEEMPPMGNPVSGVAGAQADVRTKLNNGLWEIDERLKAMVDMYQEVPSAIDSDVLRSINCVMEVEATIVKVYRIMKSCMYTEDSLFRVESNVSEAFKEQQEEFVKFYKSALYALEAYKYILQIYSITEDKARMRPQHGDLERIRQDKHTQVEERDGCIEALSNFHAKFSAMLNILRSGDLPRIWIRMCCR